MPVLGITGSIATGKSTFAQRLKRRLNAELFDADAVARELLESDPAVKKEILSVFGPDVAGPDGNIDRAKLRSLIFEPLGSPANRPTKGSARPPETNPVKSPERSSADKSANAAPPATPPAAPTEAGPLWERPTGSSPEAETPGTTTVDRSHADFRAASQPATAASNASVATSAALPHHASHGPTRLSTPKEKLEAILHPRIRARWTTLAASFRTPSTAGVSGEKVAGTTSQPWLIVDIPLLFETGAEAAFDVIAVVACGGDTQRSRLRQRGLSPELAQTIIESQLDLLSKMKRASHVIWSESSLTFLDEQAAVLAAHLQQRYG